MSIHPRRLSSGRNVYDVKLRDPTGRQYGRSFRTRKEAEAFELEQRSSRMQGGWVGGPESGEAAP